MTEAKNLGAPYELVRWVAKSGQAAGAELLRGRHRHPGRRGADDAARRRGGLRRLRHLQVVRPGGAGQGHRPGHHALQGSRHAGQGLRGPGRGDARHRDLEARRSRSCSRHAAGSEHVRPDARHGCPPTCRCRWTTAPATISRRRGPGRPACASTAGGAVDLAVAAARPAVLFFYPRTGEPGQAAGTGVERHSRGARLHAAELRLPRSPRRVRGARGAVIGVSTQETDYQREFVARNHVPFDLLSDARPALTRALRLPTFEYPVERGGPSDADQANGVVRGARADRAGLVSGVPADRNAETVLAWLERGRVSGRGERG